MFDRDDSASTALISFVLGSLAGASLAVLFAPGAGSETRRRIGAGFRDGAERTRHLARRGRAALGARDGDGRARATLGNGAPGQSERVPEPGLPSTSRAGAEPL